MLVFAILLALLAVILFIMASRQRQKAGIPVGKVIYADASQWGKVEKPLYDEDLRLTGKPDYLIQKGTQVIPIEVKSRTAPPSPHESHIYQLIAYCVLVEYAYKKRPQYGIIHYADKSFAIGFSTSMEKKLRQTVGEMQSRADGPTIDRSHQDAKRCQHCGYRLVCDQSLRI